MAHSTLFSWDDALIVPVVAVDKGEVSFVRERRIYNSPMRYLWGKELDALGSDPIIIVEWRGKITAADVNTPIKFRGKTYEANWASGSMIKERKTYGFVKGFRPLANALEEVEQSTKVGRAVLPNGVFAQAGHWLVKTVDEGELFGEWPEGDGFGYIPERSLPSNWRDTAISLGQCKQNYQIWQQLSVAPNYDSLLEEFKVHIDEWWENGYAQQHAAGTVGLDDNRRALVEANHEMVHHPYVVGRTDDGLASYFRQIASCLMIQQDMYLAVPAVRGWVLPVGEYIASRFPIASYSGTRWIDSRGSSEAKRIGKLLGAVQVTFTARRADGTLVSAKALLGVVPDSEWKSDADICTSIQNWKFGPKEKGLHTMDGVLTALSVYDNSRFLGVSPKEFKIMAGDFDGDYIAIMEAPAMPELKRAMCGLPVVENVKTKKTHTKIGDRGAGEFLVNAMNANLGWATNNRSATFAATPAERLAIAEACHKAGMIKSPKVADLDAWTTLIVQETVDALKSFIKTSVINGWLGKLNGILTNVIGGTPSYLRWKGSEWAWRVGMPVLWSQLPPELLELAAYSKEFRKGPEMKSHVRDEVNGLIADIFRYNSRPVTEDGKSLLRLAWEASAEREDAHPLITYRDWAPPVEEADIEKAKKFQLAYDAWIFEREAARASGSYDASDLDQVAEWHEEWQTTCLSLSAKLFGGDNHRACYALWHLCHSSASKLSQAAAVFIGFPRIALSIVMQASVRECSNTFDTILVGMGYNFSVVPDRFEGEVVVIGEEVHSATGHPRLKGTLVAKLGQISVKNADSGLRRPEEGRYSCIAMPFSDTGKVWRATLTRVRETS